MESLLSTCSRTLPAPLPEAAQHGGAEGGTEPGSALTRLQLVLGSSTPWAAGPGAAAGVRRTWQEGTCCPGVSAPRGQMWPRGYTCHGDTGHTTGLPTPTRMLRAGAWGEGRGIGRFRLCEPRHLPGCVRGTRELAGPPPARRRVPAGKG